MFARKLAMASLVSGLISALASGAAVAGSVDLTSVKGITIGGGIGGFGPTAKFVPWGGSVTLSQANSIASGNGRCAFDVTFDVVNKGDAATAIPFGTTLVATRLVAATINGVPSMNGKPDFPENLNAYIAAKPYNLQVNAGQSKNISTQPYLPAGTFSLQLRIDAENVVTESNEGNNNLPAITVTLPDLCGGVAVAKTEPKPAPTPVPAPKPEPKPEPKPVAKVDIASSKGITIGGAIGGAGGKFVPWGSTVLLSRRRRQVRALGQHGAFV